MVVVTADLPLVVVRVIFTGVTPIGNATVLAGGGCCCIEILGTCKDKATINLKMTVRRNEFY